MQKTHNSKSNSSSCKLHRVYLNKLFTSLNSHLTWHQMATHQYVLLKILDL